MSNPKVFISHAGEDKDRFVLGFAQKLRGDGVDAWLDKWEMLPGDSLIDKIFDEGIGKSSAFIIVVSSNSIQKKWVREELNAGMVQRIEGKTKLIPILIDDCEVPKCLQYTVWERITDLDSYENEYNRVLHSIFGMDEKPSLGQPPAYTTLRIEKLPGLNAIDTALFTHACNYGIEQTNTNILQPSMFRVLSELDLKDDGIMESLEVLESLHYVKLERVLGGGIPFFSITFNGLDKFLRSKENESEYRGNVDRICLCLINEKVDSSHGIADRTGLPLVIINHILEMLSGKRLIKIDMQLAHECFIITVSPLLRREYAKG